MLLSMKEFKGDQGILVAKPEIEGVPKTNISPLPLCNLKIMLFNF